VQAQARGREQRWTPPRSPALVVSRSRGARARGPRGRAPGSAAAPADRRAASSRQGGLQEGLRVKAATSRAIYHRRRSRSHRGRILIEVVRKPGGYWRYAVGPTGRLLALTTGKNGSPVFGFEMNDDTPFSLIFPLFSPHFLPQAQGRHAERAHLERARAGYSERPPRNRPARRPGGSY